MKDLKQRKISYQYETEKLKYVKDFCPHCGEPARTGTYTPDFIIGDIVVEAKGRFDSPTRSKMLCVKRDNPKVKLHLLFQRNNTLNKSSSTTYVEWSLKHGFICAVGNFIPQEWLPKRRNKC
jgi:hypothetical protein